MEIETALQATSQRLMKHPIYREIVSAPSVRIFLRAHVFCVWDFQSLLKALQRQLTCVEVPWLPTPDPQARRLINEIVLDEESDEDGEGGYCSHFELYLKAMHACGAELNPIVKFIAKLREGHPIEALLESEPLPEGVAAFTGQTFRIVNKGQLHEIAAAFTYGREDIIPEMFVQLVSQIAAEAPQEWNYFLLYLRRHIQHDGERHGPLSKQLLARLCGKDPIKWQQAIDAAKASLEARIQLWDAILKNLKK